jgi:hypothetical protein
LHVMHVVRDEAKTALSQNSQIGKRNCTYMPTLLMYTSHMGMWGYKNMLIGSQNV